MTWGCPTTRTLLGTYLSVAVPDLVPMSSTQLFKAMRSVEPNGYVNLMLDQNVAVSALP